MEELPQNHSSPTREITLYFNVNNAKAGAFILVLGFILYHGFIHLKYGKMFEETAFNYSTPHFLFLGNDSCKWLLGDGRYQGYNAWQPYGCMMHHYTDRQNLNQRNVPKLIYVHYI